MKQFNETELNKFSSTVKAIYRQILEAGSEDTIYEIVVAIEFQIVDGKSIGRGGVSFSAGGTDGPSIFEM